MIGLDDIRAYAMSLPEVEEKPHFGMPSFRVRGKAFAGPERDGVHFVVAVPLEDARAAVAAEPGRCEEVWRNANVRSFVGLRLDLGQIPPDRLRELIELAWRTKAPKRLVAAYDDDRGER